MHDFQPQAAGSHESLLLGPQVPGDMVPRPSLWARLDTGTQRPLTLVLAPGGYGKTTLVASWLEHRHAAPARADDELHVAWYTISSLDNTLLYFVSALAKAVRMALPAAMEGVTQLLKGGMELTAEGLALQWLQDVARLSGRLLLILDDYHEVHEPALHTFIATVLARTGRAFSLVLLSRSEPPFSLALLRSRHQVTQIGLHDLQLTTAESIQLLTGMLQRAITPEETALLQQHVEGWAAGIRLLALSMQGRTGMAARLTRTSRLALPTAGDYPMDYFMDYFMDEVLAKQPAAVREFLVLTSLLPMLRLDLCGALLGPTADAVGLLEHVIGHNLFVVPVQGEAETWRYHDIFRVMLEVRLHRSLTAEQITAAYRRIADAFAAQDECERAIEYYLFANAPDAACAVVEANVAKLQNREDWQLLDGYLARLPAASINANPELLLAQAWLYLFRYQLARLRETLAQVTRLLDTHQDTLDPTRLARLRAEHDLLEMDVNIYVARPEDLPEVDRRVQAALDLLPVECEFLRGSAWLYMGRQYQRCRRFADAIARIEQELTRVDPRQTTYVSRLYQAMASVHGYETEFGALGGIIRNCLDVAGQAGLRVAETRAKHVALGEYYYSGTRDDYTLHMCRDVLATPFLAMGSTLLTLTYLQVVVLAQRGARAETEQVLADFRALLGVIGNPETRAYYDFLEAAAAVWLGEPERARPWLMRYNIEKTNLDTPILGLTWGEGMLALQTPEILCTGRDGMQLLVKNCRAINARVWLCEAEVILARLHAALGETEQAEQVFHTALAGSRRGDMRRPYLVADPALDGLLARFAQDPEVGGFVQQVMGTRRALGRTGATVPVSGIAVDGANALEEPLTAREQAILQLLARQMTLREIAQTLNFSLSTIEKEVGTIYHKFGVHKRREAVVCAQRLGILTQS